MRKSSEKETSSILKTLFMPSDKNLIIEVNIDFNGGGEAIVPSRDVDGIDTGELIGRRLAAKGLMNMRYNDALKNPWFESNRLRLGSQDVLKQIFNQHRATNPIIATTDPVLLFLHIDEHQLAIRDLSNLEHIPTPSDFFAKEICDIIQFNQIEQQDQKNNIVVILMTGTNRGINFDVSKIRATAILLKSFTEEETRDYLQKRNHVHRDWFKKKCFRKLLNEVGNLPALTSIAFTHLDLKILFQTPPTANYIHHTTALAYEMLTRISTRYFRTALKYDEETLVELIRIIICGEIVTEQTIVGEQTDVTIYDLANNGWIVLYPIDDIKNDLCYFRVFMCYALLSKHL